ncbi:MAG TPA: class I SAM-dependent methyltransferase [Flavitalea sp.]|nr:class I SAM-dependent methyltransferase [Flavitalea sp.]
MSEQQFKAYAKFYNLLYKDKDYTTEAGYVDLLLKKYYPKEKKDISLLDLACGTGKHLFELASLGYQHLSGSDIAKEMIDIARESATMKGKNARFYNYSFQESHQIPGKFDIVISMFSAVNYITSFNDQLQTFRNIYSHLEAEGLFIFDYWNGNAVVRDYSPVKVLRKKHDKAEIIRISKTEIDLVRQHATVTFNCLYLEEQTKINEFEEVHHLHYYFFQEIHNLLSIAGFDVIHQSPFLAPDSDVGAYDWNISVVARKRKK